MNLSWRFEFVSFQPCLIFDLQIRRNVIGVPFQGSVLSFLLKTWISLFCCFWRLVSSKEKNCIVFSGYGMLQSEMKEKLKITVSSGDFNSFGKVYGSERDVGS
jgi:hypothetical protein